MEQGLVFFEKVELLLEPSLAKEVMVELEMWSLVLEKERVQVLPVE
jgi:hypothetical protein